MIKWLQEVFTGRTADATRRRKASDKGMPNEARVVTPEQVMD